MPRHCNALLRAAVVMAVLVLPALLIAAPSAAAVTPQWDHAPVPIPCGGKEVVTFDPSTHQSAIGRFDDVTHKAVTVVVFFDAGNVEADGRAFRYHFTSSNGPLTYQIGAHDVTVLGPICAVPPAITGPGPKPAPPVWEYHLTVPCGEDPSVHYIHQYGYQITWIGPNQDKVIFDTWLDASHIAGPGHDVRWTIETDHAFPGCKLFWTDHWNDNPPHSDVSWLARRQDTSAPARDQ